MTDNAYKRYNLSSSELTSNEPVDDFKISEPEDVKPPIFATADENNSNPTGCKFTGTDSIFLY